MYRPIKIDAPISSHGGANDSVIVRIKLFIWSVKTDFSDNRNS